MLRTIFVLGIIVIGSAYAIRQPFYSLLLYLWLAYFRPEQWVWYDFISGLHLSLLVGIWTVFSAVFSRERFRLNVRIAMLTLFLLQGLLSTAFASSSETAWYWYPEFFKSVLIAYLIAMLATTADRFRLVLQVIALSLGFEAAKQGWANLILSPGSPNNNDLPQLGDNNGIALGMLMLVPVLTALASTATRKTERWFGRFLAVGVVNRAITTYSRGGFLAALALALVYVLRSRKRVPAIVGITVAAVIVLPVLPTSFWDRMATIRSPDEIQQEAGNDNEMSGANESALGRLHFWHVAVLMANAEPLVGVGFNCFNGSYDSYDDMRGAHGSGRSVHSAWFGVLAELGYPGLLLFVAQLVLGFGACRRARRAAKLRADYAWLGQFGFALEASFIVFVVAGTFLPSQYAEIFWHWIGLSIALDGLARTALGSSTVAVPVPQEADQSALIPTVARIQ
jgi:probable O-glycosylation ligase (exosortase A-associated)